MNDAKLSEYIILSSIPLRKIGDNKMPIEFASGCLIYHNKKRILLTVQHATGDMGNWAAEVRYEYGKGTQLYQLGSMHFLASINLSNLLIKDIDFSYVSVPNDFVSFYQEITPEGQIIYERPRNICKVTWGSEPDVSELYGFSGQVMLEVDRNKLTGEVRLCTGLKYIGMEDDFYIFKVPFSYSSLEYLEGCSGAPIIDTRGNVVALVCEGEVSTDRIFGISLKKYRLAIDITYGNLAKDAEH